MTEVVSLVISLLALLATFYQLYLQRRHDEKSLKPLVQIDLIDRNGLISVHVQNNGIGPLIVKRITFIKNEESHSNIEDCLKLDPKSYQHMATADVFEKVILAGTFLEVFSWQRRENDTEEQAEYVRQQLAVIKVKVDGQDIYNNKVITERELRWFTRHSI